MTDKCQNLKELKACSFELFPQSAGIYRLHSPFGSYVGQSRNLRSRLRQHAKELASGSHKNSDLTLVFDAIGEELLAEVLELVPSGLETSALTVWLDGRESFWMERYGGTLNSAAANSSPLDYQKNALQTLRHNKELASLRQELQYKSDARKLALASWEADMESTNKELHSLRSDYSAAKDERSPIARMLGIKSKKMTSLEARIRDLEIHKLMTDDGIGIQNSPYEISREIDSLSRSIEIQEDILKHLAVEKELFGGQDRAESVEQTNDAIQAKRVEKPSNTFDPIPVTKEFLECWKSAGRHLNNFIEAENSAVFLRFDLPAFADHFSFRFRNQLFFVQFYDVDNADNGWLFPGRLESLSEWTGGHACLLPMKRSGDIWEPIFPGWGLITTDFKGQVNPNNLALDAAPVLSDWEVHDCGVQLVRDMLLSDSIGYEIVAWQSMLGLDPQIVARHGEQYVMVLTRAVANSEDGPNIPDAAAKVQQHAVAWRNCSVEVYLIKLASGEMPFDPKRPIRRGDPILPHVQGPVKLTAD
ncbi:MAG: hypothetical protein DDT34_02335 [Firmicutes bacterium]|nr:hypothetical protein [Bacillota bacterium]